MNAIELSGTYLVIDCGYEGIEELCFLSQDKNEVIKRTKELKQKKIQEKRDWINKDILKYGRNSDTTDKMIEDEILRAADSICVKRWDGIKFKCCCEELGVSPSEKWFC